MMPSPHSRPFCDGYRIFRNNHGMITEEHGIFRVCSDLPPFFAHNLCPLKGEEKKRNENERTDRDQIRPMRTNTPAEARAAVLDC